MLKILHVATFTGNVGDNASHIGFKSVMDEIIGTDYEIDQLEIRKTYKVYTLSDKWRFDEDFARKANKYDLLLIGGGHFLDFWVENSHTATTLDISDVVLKMINVPICIISMGCMHRNEIPDGNIPKLKSFLDKLIERPKTFVGLRNDSSKRVMKEQIGMKYYEALPEVLDSGFFYTNSGESYLPTPRPYALIQSTVDQLQMKSFKVAGIDEVNYNEELSGLVNDILEKTDLDIVFAPHIYHDYQAIGRLLEDINDFHIRERVQITPYAQGNFGCDQLFAAYKNCRMMVGMRFHANVCSISMGKLSFGLGATDRVHYIYNSLGIEDRLFTVDEPFRNSITERIQSSLQSDIGSSSIQNDLLEQKRKETKNIYREMFNDLLS